MVFGLSHQSNSVFFLLVRMEMRNEEACKSMTFSGRLLLSTVLLQQD
ncbi:hypothetical protein TSMEX_009717 [Taenia solium]|eukprot:TsM_000563300 transcript=TsM_000563300 gene=TsM_000563300